MELTIKHLSKRYGEKLALDDFSYTFRDGIYGILGANGAGKSTLMHLITVRAFWPIWPGSRGSPAGGSAPSWTGCWR